MGKLRYGAVAHKRATELKKYWSYKCPSCGVVVRVYSIEENIFCNTCGFVPSPFEETRLKEFLKSRLKHYGQVYSQIGGTVTIVKKPDKRVAGRGTEWMKDRVRVFDESKHINTYIEKKNLEYGCIRKLGDGTVKMWNGKRWQVIAEPLRSPKLEVEIEIEIGAEKDINGYIYIWDGHQWGCRYILVMERLLGRKLTQGELVHHRNGIHDDDSPGNLMLCISHKYPHPRGYETQHTKDVNRFLSFLSQIKEVTDSYVSDEQKVVEIETIIYWLWIWIDLLTKKGRYNLPVVSNKTIVGAGTSNLGEDITDCKYCDKVVPMLSLNSQLRRKK